jgi:hypothetical protein
MKFMLPFMTSLIPIAVNAGSARAERYLAGVAVDSRNHLVACESRCEGVGPLHGKARLADLRGIRGRGASKLRQRCG